MRSHPNRLAVAALVLAVLAVGGSRLSEPDEARVLALAAQTTSGNGSCDVTGVGIGYTTAWSATPAPGRFVVSAATVDAIQQPSCQGATLTVRLRHTDAATQQSTDVAVAQAVVGSSPTQTLVFATPPAAADVNDVYVELNGGYTPVPPECQALKLTNIVLGTTGDDTIDDSKGGNLIYTLSGTDMVTTGGRGDCIVGDPGNKRIIGAAGSDVVLLGDGVHVVDGGPGADVIKVGNGDGNVLNGGNGEDVLYVGTGTGNVLDGGSGNKNVCHVPYPVSQLAAHGTVVRNCTVVSP